MSEASPQKPAGASKGAARFRPILLLPLALFTALAIIFFVSLRSGVDPEAMPSALVGKPAPDFDCRRCPARRCLG